MEFEDLDFDHFDVSAALRHSVCHLRLQGGTNMKRAKTSCWCHTDQCASVPIMHQWGKPTEASENQQSSESGALIPVWLFAHSRYIIERLSLYAVLLYVYNSHRNCGRPAPQRPDTKCQASFFFLRSDVKECAFAPKLCCVVAVSCSLVVTAPPLPGDEGDDLSVAPL